MTENCTICLIASNSSLKDSNCRKWEILPILTKAWALTNSNLPFGSYLLFDYLNVPLVNDVYGLSVSSLASLLENPLGRQVGVQILFAPCAQTLLN